MAFMGMRGTGDWVTDQRPKNWRETILRLYPNGMAPLTAIMSKMASESTDDPEFNWWTKSLPSQGGAITGIYTNVALSTAYVSGGVVGDILYVKMTAALAGECRAGHIVRLVYSGDPSTATMVRITSVVINGASSYIAVKLLEADDNSTSYDLSNANYFLISGTSHAEGAIIPDAIAYDPTKWYNYTQIFRNALDITRTAKLTRLRGGEAYAEAKRECLELHSIEMEKGFMFGVPTEVVGSNGKPERTTLGLIPAIKGGYTGSGGSAGTVAHFPTDTNYSGDTWLAKGEHFLDTYLEVMFRYGKKDKLAFCGSSALLAINRLIKYGGEFTYTEKRTSYGINVGHWTTPFGAISLITHPLMSYDVTLRDQMVIFEPSGLKYRYITDTTFKKDDRMDKGQWTAQDGLKEEYLTEAGLEYHFPIGWGYLTGLGTDNTL